MLELLVLDDIAVVVKLESDTGGVVEQSVDPDVDYVTVVEVDRNAPLERRARHAEVLKSGLYEVVDHLAAARLGLDEVGVLLDIFEQAILIIAHFEEVGFFVRLFDRTTAVGAFAVDYLRLGEEGFAGDAVPALIRTFVDVALLVQLLEHALNRLFVVVVGCADELVVGRADEIPDLLDLARHAVDVGFRRDSGFVRERFDLHAVLVSAGHEEHVLALLTLTARDRVGHDDLVGVADMRLARRVRDRGGYIEFLFIIAFTHRFTPFARIMSVSTKLFVFSGEMPFEKGTSPHFGKRSLPKCYPPPRKLSQNKGWFDCLLDNSLFIYNSRLNL